MREWKRIKQSKETKIRIKVKGKSHIAINEIENNISEFRIQNPLDSIRCPIILMIRSVSHSFWLLSLFFVWLHPMYRQTNLDLNHLCHKIPPVQIICDKTDKKRGAKQKMNLQKKGPRYLLQSHNCIMSNVELNWVENAHKKCRYGSIKSISQYHLAVQLIWSLLQK